MSLGDPTATGPRVLFGAAAGAGASLMFRDANAWFFWLVVIPLTILLVFSVYQLVDQLWPRRDR